jgi:hypothetical protein
MLNKVKLIIICLFVFSSMIIYSQDNKPKESENKYSTVNIKFEKITDTRYGVILEYFGKEVYRTIYLSDYLFQNNIAVKVWEEDYNVAGQANVVYKDGKPFRIKIYVPRNASDLTYRFKEYVTDEEKEKFKSKELIILD